MSDNPGAGPVKPVVIDTSGQCQGGPAIPVYSFDYTKYWNWYGVGAGIIGAAVVVELGVIIHLLKRQDCKNYLWRLEEH